MSRYSVTKVIEFDAGHRVPSHKGKCRNLHGHRYRLEATIEGEIKPVTMKSDDAMVVDFGDVKKLLMEIHDDYDHKCLIWTEDPIRAQLVGVQELTAGIVLLHAPPTVEHLAKVIFMGLAARIDQEFKGEVSLAKVRLFETPNSWTDIVR